MHEALATAVAQRIVEHIQERRYFRWRWTDSAIRRGGYSAAIFVVFRHDAAEEGTERVTPVLELQGGSAGGAGSIRTTGKDFADLCLPSWLPRLLFPNCEMNFGVIQSPKVLIHR
jgi:hypothetical protein